MNFPDEVVILRATGTDAYGNEEADWTDDVTSIFERGYEAIESTLLLLPRSTAAQQGDRYVIGDETYTGFPSHIKSPSSLKLVMVRLKRVED